MKGAVGHYFFPKHVDAEGARWSPARDFPCSVGGEYLDLAYRDVFPVLVCALVEPSRSPNLSTIATISKNFSLSLTWRHSTNPNSDPYSLRPEPKAVDTSLCDIDIDGQGRQVEGPDHLERHIYPPFCPLVSSETEQPLLLLGGEYVGGF